MEEFTRPTSSPNNPISSSHVVVVRTETPRTSYSDEELRSFVDLANVVSGAVDGGVQRHQKRTSASTKGSSNRLVPESTLVKPQAAELGSEYTGSCVYVHST